MAKTNESSAPLLFDDPASGVRRITLNRPERLNALTFDMVDEIVDELERVRLDVQTSVVVITGAGRGFCSGHDRGDHADPRWMSPGIGPVQRGSMILRRMGQVVTLMQRMPQIVITAVNGAVAGAGYPIAIGADITLASESAFFVNGFNLVGGGGGELGMSYLLPRRVGLQRATELMLTGRRLHAPEAKAMGLVLECYPGEELQEAALSLAAEIMSLPPMGVAQTKGSIHACSEMASIEAAIEFETRGQVLAMQTEDAGERRAALADDRAPKYLNR